RRTGSGLTLEMSMIAVRAAKAATVAAIALFASLVTFGNLTDYDTNLAFVQHVLSMDTIFPSSAIKYRAITNPALQQAAYAIIVAAEAATAVLLLDRRGRARAAAARQRWDVQSRQERGHCRLDPRLPALARRVYGDRRRMVRDVGVAALERRAERVPL